MKKKILAICLLVSLLGTSTSAQQDHLEEERRILLNTVGDDLDILAQEKGYHLDKTSLRLSYPWSNLLSPINVATVVAGGSVFAFVSGLVGTPITITLAIGGVAGGVAGVAGVKDPSFYHHKMVLVNHYRSKVSFSLMNDEGRKVRTESCILFYSIKEDLREIDDYEIDNCSNDDIFPQNEEGFLRVGTRTGWFEKYVSDQDNVVASCCKRYYIPIPLDEFQP